MILATLRKELVVIWASPLPWMGGALFHVLWGALYVTELEARRQALFQPGVPLVAFLLLVLVPVLGMRTISEELRHGTLDVLLASPVSATRVVIGKWAAVAVTSAVIVAPVAAPLTVIERWGNFDPGGVLAAALGLVLLAWMLAAASVLLSALTASQAMAAAAAFLSGLMLWFAAAAPGSAGQGLLARLSISERLATFAAGGIDTGDATYFLVVTVVAILLASVAVGRRRARPRAGLALLTRVRISVGVVVVVVLGVTAVAAADANRRLADLTTGSALTLSEATVATLRSVSSPVEVTAFVARDDPARVAVSSLLSRYRRANPNVAFSVKEPDEAPVELRRIGVDPVFGGIAVRHGTKAEVASTPTEQDITAAMARVVRDSVPHVCASTGHGEAGLDDRTDGGLSALGEALGGNGYETSPVNLLASPDLPDRCDALLVAGPTAAWSAPAVTAVTNWLARDGRALVLTDPATEIDWSPLLAPFGVEVDRGIVFELDADHRFPDDPTRPIVLDYRTASPIGRRLPPTFYPGAQALLLGGEDVPGLTIEVVATTTERSFLERAPLEPAYDEGVDRRGPLALVVAADRSARAGEGVRRARVVVAADADLATNAFVGEAGNTALLVRSLDWLTRDDDIVSVSANLAPVRPLELTAGRLRYLRMLTIAVVPAMFLVAGALGWVLRRAR